MIPIDEVTLFEDRAQVVRRAEVGLEAGRNTIEFAISPLLVDKSLLVKWEGEGVSLVEAIPHRTGHRTKKSVTDLELQLLDLQVQHKALEDQRAALQQDLARVHELQKNTLIEHGENASWGREDCVPEQAVMEQLLQTRLDHQEKVVSLRHQALRIKKTMTDLNTRIKAMVQPDEQISCTLKLAVWAKKAIQATCEVRYLVPNACWRPWHRARYQDGVLIFTAGACVWQYTGEDWSDVQLHFSTERASLGVSPPHFSDDLLTAFKANKTVEIAAREQTIEEAGDLVVQKVTVVPGIEDGGEALALSAVHRINIPSDGRPYRGDLFQTEMPSQFERVLMAELEPVVLLRTQQVNTHTLPLLAGPVDLFRASGPVGRAHIKYISPNESFELGWGPDVDLRVSRKVVRKATKQGLLSAWKGYEEKIQVLISNLGPRKKEVQVLERIPVSEHEKVKITVQASGNSEQKMPDENGFISWTSHINAHSRLRVEHQYALSHHKDVSGLT